MESNADSDGHRDSVGRNYGGGWATRRGMERATETKQRWVGCTQGANPILSIPAIVASNPGDFGQGRVRVDSTSASRFLPESVALIRHLYEKRFSYKTIASTDDSVKGQVATNGPVHSRIGA